MADRRTCVFCNGINNSREHVLAAWFLERWDGQGPFTASINGEPLLTRAQRPAQSEKIWRVMLPCCSECNNALDKSFEKPAKGPVRRLLNDLQPLDAAADIRHLSRWVAKTLALYVHPAAVHGVYASRRFDQDDPREDPKRHPGEWADYPSEVLASIRRGELADDLTLWMAVAYSGGRPDPEFDQVWLRHTTRSDGRGGTGHSVTVGFNLLGTTRTAFFQLVYHPLHDIVHPFEAHGLVTRLWPNPPSHLDLKSHAALHTNTRLGSVLIDGDGISEGLAPTRRAVGNGLPSYLRGTASPRS